MLLFLVKISRTPIDRETLQLESQRQGQAKRSTISGQPVRNVPKGMIFVFAFCEFFSILHPGLGHTTIRTALFGRGGGVPKIWVQPPFSAISTWHTEFLYRTDPFSFEFSNSNGARRRTTRNGNRESAFKPHNAHGPYAVRSYPTVRESQVRNARPIFTTAIFTGRAPRPGSADCGPC